MSTAAAQQEVHHTVHEDGTIEVTVTPIVKENISAHFLDKKGVRHFGYTTEQELRAIANIPQNYHTKSFQPNNWAAQDKEGPFICHQSKGFFSPPAAEEKAIEALLQHLKEKSRVVPRLYPKIRFGSKVRRRMLEISVMDPHLGLQCFRPGADSNYDLEQAEKTFLWAVNNLLALGEHYGPFEEILFPFGNDYLHAEMTPAGKGVGHATAAGTIQPEMMAWHYVYERAEKLLIQTIEMLKDKAPVYLLEIPGNHDRYSAFTIGRVMNAWFHNDENVAIDASPSPYKFKHYGVNLIGFEHGHSVAPIRLAALMANECRDIWAQIKYAEWHLGDQHRKGASKPSVFEEQGVSIEFLPSIVAPNEWHRLKGFNHQKRGAMAWVWDYESGPIARLQVNLDNSNGGPMGGGSL